MQNTTYCLKCKTHTLDVNPQTQTTALGKQMIKSTCSQCSSKKNKFIKIIK